MCPSLTNGHSYLARYFAIFIASKKIFLSMNLVFVFLNYRMVECFSYAVFFLGLTLCLNFKVSQVPRGLVLLIGATRDFATRGLGAACRLCSVS